MVRTDANGRVSLRVQVTHSRPTAAGFFGIWALPHGVPIAYMPIGGWGSGPEDPRPTPDALPVFIATDMTGMYGHECPSCHGYWRGEGSVAVCPYCGIRTQRHHFLTKAQRGYVKQYCEALNSALSASEDGDHIIDMDAVADATGQQTEKPPFYYAEESQQNKFKCEACGAVNDILGTYGYCCTCATRNDLQQIRTAMQKLRDRVNAGGPYESCAKEAVAAFDSLAAQYTKQLMRFVPLTAARRARLDRSFHNLDTTTELFRSVFDIDLVSGISAEDIKFAELMFHRRHVYEHNGGEADEKYIRESGDTGVRLKQALRESQESVHRLIGLVLKISANLHAGFHQLIPPLPEPVRLHEERNR